MIINSGRIAEIVVVVDDGRLHRTLGLGFFDLEVA